MLKASCRGDVDIVPGLLGCFHDKQDHIFSPKTSQKTAKCKNAKECRNEMFMFILVETTIFINVILKMV